MNTFQKYAFKLTIVFNSLLYIDATAYQHSQQRPCGWYQMTDADKTECQ